MYRRLGVLLITLCFGGILLALPNPARAALQDPTPEPTAAPPTPTPSSILTVQLSTGSDFVIDKRVTAGDIAIVVSLLLLLAVQLLGSMVTIPARWYKGKK